MFSVLFVEGHLKILLMTLFLMKYVFEKALVCLLFYIQNQYFFYLSFQHFYPINSFPTVCGMALSPV